MLKQLLLCLSLVMQVACAASTQSQKVQRLPLQKNRIVLNSPTQYEHREVRTDPQTGKPVTYDPKPRVELVDAGTGRYVFKWIGYDGKEKIVEYQRMDAIDIVVAASVSKTPEGEYLYSYTVKNLLSSGTYLSTFTLQNFASDVRPVEVNGKSTNIADIRILKLFREAPPDDKSRNIAGMIIGEMSEQIYLFREGNWIAFGVLESFTPAVVPGQELELRLTSSAPPGIVGCRVAGGQLTLKGAGEHMPTELENVMSGYEEMPWGYTIGPIDNLKTLSPIDRTNYVFDRLPQFEQLGWMTADARKWYEKNIKRKSLEGLIDRAEQDLKAERITSEVFGLIQFLKHN